MFTKLMWDSATTVAPLVTQPPLAKVDRLVFMRLAHMEVRQPEAQVTASFADEADEDPLDGLP